MKNRIYRTLLAMLGFSVASCRVMYGSPEILDWGIVNIKGTVIDSEGNPIPGIQVKDSYTDISSTTDASGEMEMSVEHVWNQEFDLCFEDPDGPENGGTFARDTLFYKDMNIRQVGARTFELNFKKKLHPAQDGE